MMEEKELDLVIDKIDERRNTAERLRLVLRMIQAASTGGCFHIGWNWAAQNHVLVLSNPMLEDLMGMLKKETERLEKGLA